jgi:hypothetical protein
MNGTIGHKVTVQKFCSRLPRSADWAGVVRSAATLAQVSHRRLVAEGFSSADRQALPDAEWVYIALEHLEARTQSISTSTDGLEGLLQALLMYGPPRPKPSPQVVGLIVRGLSAPGKIPALALRVVSKAVPWFQDQNLARSLQELDAWSHVGRVVLQSLQDSDIKDEYIRLGNTLANTPGWEAYIREDISTWIYIFTAGMPWSWMDGLKFASVLDELFSLTQEDIPLDPAERMMGSIAMVLSQTWEKFDRILSLETIVQLAHSTASVIFFEPFAVLDLPEGRDSGSAKSISSSFKANCLEPLRSALFQAAKMCGISSQAESSDISPGDLERVSKILTGLASISSESADGNGQSGNAEKLSELQLQIDALRENRLGDRDPI